ncbi:MAG: transposase [Desulfovibrionales bacterium]|nr:transposase [Desulfovibrionales bacterium]
MKNEDIIAMAGAQRVFRSRFKLDTPGLISHITQRAAGREPLFLEDNDYLAMLGIFKKKAEQYHLDFIAFSQMPNHTHILIKPKEKNLFPAMRDIFSGYAKWFNRKYQRKGHLFGGAYRQAVCLDSAYLLAASAYIHLNPVKAGLTDDVLKYRWSSCSLYYKDEPVESFINPRPVLEVLDEDFGTAVSQYRLILKEAREVKQENVLEKEGVVERFCLRLSEVFPSIFSRLAKKSVNPDIDIHEQPSFVDIENMVRNFKAMVSTRDPQTKRARKYVVEQLQARGFSQKEIAHHLKVSQKTIYTILNYTP